MSVNSPKILVVSNMYPSSEKPFSGIFVKNLYEKINEKHGDTELLAMKRRFTNGLSSVIKYLIFYCSSFRFLFVRYDVVHLHFFYPLITWVWIYKKLHPDTKVVVTFHGSDVHQHFNTAMSRRAARKVAGCVDTYIAVSESLKLDAEAKLDIRVNEILPAGVDDSIFNSMGRDVEKQYDFIFVGSFVERKGVIEYIKAINRISRKLRFCFVGSGPLEKNIVNHGSHHDIVILNNLAQPEIANLYKKSKFLVLPSRSEPFGLVVSEAMFCGTPVLASNEGGIVMQVEDGMNGFLFEKGNVDSIVDALERASNMKELEYSELSERASWSNKQFSLTNVVDRHSALYRELLHESKA
jgi:glycosyltransferase involved in cell wall biosynthesis